MVGTITVVWRRTTSRSGSVAAPNQQHGLIKSRSTCFGGCHGKVIAMVRGGHCVAHGPSHAQAAIATASGTSSDVGAL